MKRTQCHPFILKERWGEGREGGEPVGRDREEMISRDAKRAGTCI